MTTSTGMSMAVTMPPAENIDQKSVEETTINGLPAATATAKGDQWVFRLYAVRFGSDVYRLRLTGQNKLILTK